MLRTFLVCLTIFLSACSSITDETTGDAMITEHTKMNKDLVQMLADRSFVFDIKLKDESIEEVCLFVDYYKDGELVEEIHKFATHTSDQEKITVAYVQQIFQDTYETWKLITMNEDGYGASESENENPAKRTEQSLRSTWTELSLDEINKDEKIPVAYINYSTADYISNPSPVNSEVNLESLIKDITDTDYAYVLSIELK